MILLCLLSVEEKGKKHVLFNVYQRLLLPPNRLIKGRRFCQYIEYTQKSIYDERLYFEIFLNVYDDYKNIVEYNIYQICYQSLKNKQAIVLSG